MENDQKSLKSDLYKICWYMRGSITFDDAFYLTAEDKELISSVIKENLETTRKTGLPFF